MLKIIIGVIIAILIGAACRYFDIPLPAPPTFVGVALIIAIFLGYFITDKLMPREVQTSPTQVEQTK